MSVAARARASVAFHPAPQTRPIPFGVACRDMDEDRPDDRYLHRLVAKYAPYHPGGYNTDEATWRRVNPGYGGHHNLKWLTWERVCGTIVHATTVNGIVHPRRTRYLSTREIARCSSFPDDFAFPPPADKAMKRLLNCVPPLLMRAVADHLRAIAPLSPHPTVVSTFAGGGGSSLGYQMAGCDERLAVEWDDHAVATLRANFPDLPIYHGDIASLTIGECLRLAGLAPGELGILDGSPPCQGFSTSGNRAIDDPRNQLFREYARLLRGLRPRAFVMENVSGMVKGKMKLVFAEILRELKSCGYVVQVRLLNAMHYGVPQDRERLIFVGIRDDLADAIREG